MEDHVNKVHMFSYLHISLSCFTISLYFTTLTHNNIKVVSLVSCKIQEPIAGKYIKSNRSFLMQVFDRVTFAKCKSRINRYKRIMLSNKK